MKKLTFISLSVFLLVSVTSHSQTKNNFTGPVSDFDLKSRFMNITELNVGIGLNTVSRDYAKSFYNLTDILGIGITKNLTGGIGVGVSIYNGGTLVPLLADLRYFINLKKSKIFVFGEGGILLNSSNTEGGRKFLASPGIGFQFPVIRSISLNVGGGLFTQLMKDRSRDSFGNIKAGMTYFFNNK